MPQMSFDPDTAAKMKTAGAKILQDSSQLPPKELAGAVFDAMQLVSGGFGLGNGMTAASDRTGGVVGNGRTAAMDRAGADILSAGANAPAEDLAMKVYEAMARAGGFVGNG